MTKFLQGAIVAALFQVALESHLGFWRTSALSTGILIALFGFPNTKKGGE